MFTVILHEAFYTTERSWNGLRLAEKALDSGLPVHVLLFSDAVYVARKEQRPPEGSQNIGKLVLTILKGLLNISCSLAIDASGRQPTSVRGNVQKSMP